MEGATRVQSLLTKAVKNGKTSPDISSPVMIEATEALMRAHRFHAYKATYFDVPYMTSDFSALTHDVAMFDDQDPTIAASTFNSVTPIISPNGFTGIIINIIPVPGRRMAVILSYAASEADKARASLGRILYATGQSQKYELSKHLIAVTENFALNPRLVATWTPERRAAVIAAFQNTIGSASPDVGENPGFMLS